MASAAAPPPAAGPPAAPAAAHPPPAPSPAPPAPVPAPPPPLTGSVTDIDARHDTLRVLDWTVRGASKVVGDAEVGFARVHGLATIGGKLTAAAVTVDGSISVGGAARIAGSLRVKGDSEFGAELAAAEFEVVGGLAGARSLQSRGTGTVTGRLELRGDLDVADLRFTGQLLIGGSVRAGSVDGTLEGSTKIERLRADRVDLRRGSFPPWKPKGTYTGLRIEAHEVRLEGVTLEFLEADEIYLGADCRIARVEGRIVEQHRSARVGPSAVSTPWSGLTR